MDATRATLSTRSLSWLIVSANCSCRFFPGVSTGTSRTTGFLPRAITISSPRSARDGDICWVPHGGPTALSCCVSETFRKGR